jgi:hypothetical protein
VAAGRERRGKVVAAQRRHTARRWSAACQTGWKLGADVHREWCAREWERNGCEGGPDPEKGGGRGGPVLSGALVPPRWSDLA